MKRTITALGLLLVLLSLPGPLFAGSGPRISFAEREHDFGDVIHGQAPSTELTFANTGDALLVIEEIESSCGCAKAVRGSREVPPGAESRLYARIDTLGMPPGRHFKTITVHSNDADHPITRVKLIFNVIRHVSISPDALAVSLGEGVKNAVFRVKATNYWTKAITLKAVSTRGSDTVTLAPGHVVVPPGGNIDFQLSIRLEGGSGKLYRRGTVLIKTDDPLERVLPVRYFIRLPKKGGT